MWFFVFLHMRRIVLIFLLFLFISGVRGQEVRLPADLRQHNLVSYNSSLFNPAFSLDRNDPESIAFWTRWQWQSIDADPTTLFLNYTRKLNDRSTAGAAFFQHNTGVYFNTGGVLNFAYELNLTSTIQLAFGANLFGFKQKLADTRFSTNPGLPLPQLRVSNDFILQMAPGVRLSVQGLSFSMASENLLDYNFALKEANTQGSDKIFMGMLSYDFPLPMQDPNSYLRPSLYLRTVPGESNQIGLNTYLNTSKYWAQLGYNNFYGIGVGGGGTFFKKYSLGAVMEFGTSASVNSKEPSFEIVAAYFFGTPEERNKVTTYNVEMEVAKPPIDEKAKEEKAVEAQEKEAAKVEEDRLKEISRLEKARQKEIKDSIAAIKVDNGVVLSKREQRRKQDSINKVNEAEVLAEKVRQQQKRTLDSISNAREAEAIAAAKKLELQKAKDSIDQVALERAAKEKTQDLAGDKPKTGEKYEEVATFEGLEPGYYLIANVFGTKKYFDAFMKDLTNKGLEPQSFFRNSNKYNYVYLGRYNTMNEARNARDGKLNGKYPEKTWIFRVVGK